MATLTTEQIVHSIVWNSKDFRRGLTAGLSGNDRRYDLFPPCNESTVFDIIRSLCERAVDNELTYERTLYDCGLLVGYIVAATQ